jgi:hypothetical protein
MHMARPGRIVRRVLGAVALLIAAAATVFAMGAAHASSAHHAVADGGVVNSKN